MRGRMMSRQRERTALWGGLLVSVLLHALLVLLWVSPLPEVVRREAGGYNPNLSPGGGGMQALAITVPQAGAIPPPPRPVLAVEVPEVELVEVGVAGITAEFLPVGAPAPGTGAGAGAADGEDGEGGGDGVGYVAPRPRSMILPPGDAPASVNGTELTVRVFVDATGRPGLVELVTPSPDDGFNREIIRLVRGWKYDPARQGGIPTDGWAEITFEF